MGLSVSDNSYEVGEVCFACEDVIFDGVTPEYVAVDFSGIIACPFKFPPNAEPNRTFILPKIAACTWQIIEKGYMVVWSLLGGNSHLFIRSGQPFWFNTLLADPCIDEFTNALDCLHPNSWSDTGTGKVYWGPQIGKEPIS